MFAEWVAFLKKLLGIPDGDTSQDETIAFLAALALEQISAATGRKFVQGVYLDRFIPPDRIIYLTEYPVLLVESLSVGGSVIDPLSYTVEKTSGRIIIENHSCGCVPRACADASLTAQYQANGEMPPAWVSMATADAIRAAMSQMETANTYGFSAKKVAVTDVGSVEFSTMGDTPSGTLTATIDASIAPWLSPEIGVTRSCCGAPQVSQFLGEIPP